ncbi:MAG TPA: MFS transporter [Caulobacteraceae bacterium]|jgi:MFS family permease
MSVTTAGEARPANQTRMVVAASAIGTAFEWYDFFIFGTLAAIMAKQFTGGSDTAGFIFALGAFAAGFFVRPFGALFFGRLGDQIGRKAAFLITITLMGLATIAIGLLPTAAQIGSTAAILLVLMRVIQGFALGGEYGGAAIYVAEHAEDHKRGYLTSWIQTSAAFGLVGALAVILVTRTLMGEERFADWGWRIPFLLSALLLVISLYIRMQLEESPEFQRMKEEEGISKAPYKEAFGRWPNLRLVFIALFGVMLAQGAVWYAGHFYAQFFLEKVLKVPAATVNLLLIAVVLVSAALYVFFGWLSDRVGRKPVMLFGMILFVLSVFPGFHLMTRAANPALAEASERAPVRVFADPQDCTVQFDPLGRRKPVTGCDMLTKALTDAGVPYRRVDPELVGGTASGGATPIRHDAYAQAGRFVAPAVAETSGAASTSADRLTATRAGVASMLTNAGYPAAADPERINLPLVFAILLVFIVSATAVYGPQAAALVELFPTRVRYTALSLPYHIGTGWVGGFLPFTAFAMVAASGDLYFGLWYPVVFTGISIVTMLFLSPETRGRRLS